MSRRTGIARSTLRGWAARPEPPPGRSACPRCRPAAGPPLDLTAYAYLLGLYLGDGCISRLGRTYFLRVACADAWPGLIGECERAVRAVRPGNSVFRVQQQGCVMVTAYSNHWPCLLPQHGPGPKHERRIALHDWQRRIVGAYPWELVRGLVHSDGCRSANWTTRTVRGERKRYAYPRYVFTNKSADIVDLYCATLDGLGVEWRLNRHSGGGFNVSVARRASVALMDAHVGAKY